MIALVRSTPGRQYIEKWFSNEGTRNDVVSKDEYSLIHFDVGFTPEHIRKVIKWLFIEQDIAYWSNSGRNMTWGLVPNKY